MPQTEARCTLTAGTPPGKYRINMKRLQRLFGRALRLISKEKKRQSLSPNGIIQLSFVDNSEIKSINKRFRSINMPTDVISLSYLEQDHFPGDDLTGEIFISLEMSQKQAKKHQKSLQKEVELLFVHGILHVFGFDHLTRHEKAVMYSLQDQILQTDEWRPIIDPTYPACG